MSVAIRRSLYGKLAADSPLTTQLGTPPAGYSKAIYYQQAPEGSGFPYLIFSKQAGTPRYAIGARAYDSEVWLIKAIDRRDTADTADTIASRLEALLTDSTISISGHTQLLLRRESDVDYSEAIDGVLYRHAGAYFRLIYD
jgi:hypothetical protein